MPIMPPKKGQTQEEKRSKLLEFFQKSHSFYTLKEIEKDGSKFTKISSMFIKDVLLELVNDGLVNVEKCGTTNLYWSFKLDRFKRLINLHSELIKKSNLLDEKKTGLREQINQAKAARKKTDEFGNRVQLLKKLQYQKRMRKDLQDKLERCYENDPSVLEKMNFKNEKLIDGINYLTDNIEALIHYFTKESEVPIEENILRAELCIPNEFEDLPVDPSKLS